MKKTLAALALAGSIALIGSAPAMATTYPALPPQAAVSDGTVGPGEQFIFRGQGFRPFETVTITVTPGNPPAASGATFGGTSVVAKIDVFLAAQTFTATADAQGAIAFPIAISTAGTFLVSATGNLSHVTVGPVSVVVDPSFSSTGASLANSGGAPLANSGAGLANTGADSGLILWTLVGAGALAAGAASVVVVRRRAKTEAAA
jgi:LPXTG-motif cell wall-anchored protein